MSIFCKIKSFFTKRETKIVYTKKYRAHLCVKLLGKDLFMKGSKDLNIQELSERVEGYNLELEKIKESYKTNSFIKVDNFILFKASDLEYANIEVQEYYE